MADELDTQTADDWDLDELLKEFEPEVDEAEKKADDQVAKVTKGMKKIAERQARMEEQARVERLTDEFYKSASDEEKELADVLLAGVADEARVKKMLDLAKAKAKAISAGDETAKEEAEEKAEEDDTEKAFSPPANGVPPRPRDPEADLIERIGKGGRDGQDALIAALYPDGLASFHPPA